jgi:hypothetical protein
LLLPGRDRILWRSMDAPFKVEVKHSPLESHAVLGILLASFIIFPLAADGALFGTKLLQMLFQVILIGTLLAIARHRWVLFLGLGLVGGSTAVRLVPGFPDGELWADVLALAFMFILVFSSARRLLEAQSVRPELISSAVSLYLILGIAWYLAYSIVEVVAPGSFYFPDGPVEDPSAVLYYFSFVTLTTLGYGDVRPVSDFAQSLAVLEAIVGQVYLIVMVSGLVSLHFAWRRKD